MDALRRIWGWIDERTGLSGLVVPAALHPVPPESKWMYVFGSATLLAFIVQVATGIALAAIYVPSSGEAHASLQYITSEATFGRLVRGMHFFGASAMIVLIGVHMIRVYLMAAYKFPRELNWVTGVLLLGLTVTMGFTGQILRWDQNAVWSAVVGAKQAARVPLIGNLMVKLFLSGSTIGSDTLSHFYLLHVFVLPALIVAVVGLHLHLVLRHGISEPPVVGEPVDPGTYREKYHAMLERIGRPFWPFAAWRDIVFGTGVAIAIIVLAFLIGPPVLGEPADPSIVAAKPAPDWYLLWYFTVLALLPHHAENYVIVLAPIAAGALLLAVPFLSNHGERSWRRRPLAVMIVVFILTSIGVLTRAGVEENWSPKFKADPLTADVIGVSSGPVYDGMLVFNTKGCLYCHTVSGHGGKRGPDLTTVGDRRTRDQIVIRILNGGYNMPAYGNNMAPGDLDAVTAFLESRRSP